MGDIDKVKNKVVRSIDGKLKVGEALDAYTRLTPIEQQDYEVLVNKLTQEFVDPIQKRKFSSNFDYNKRKEGQKIKAFMMEMKHDMDRYSELPAYIGTGNNRTPNGQKTQGVRRFLAGKTKI